MAFPGFSASRIRINDRFRTLSDIAALSRKWAFDRPDSDGRSCAVGSPIEAAQVTGLHFSPEPQLKISEFGLPMWSNPAVRTYEH